MKKLLFGILVGSVVLGSLAGCFSFGRGHGPVDAFQFLTSRNPGLDQNVTGVIHEQADPAEISVVIPPAAGSLNLVATFSLNTEAVISVVSSGRPVVQQNGVSRNDFSAPVLYSLQVPGDRNPWRYRVTVRYAETNAALSQISIPEGYAMSPLFSPRVKSYTVEVPYSVNRVRIEAKGQSDTLRDITIDGASSGGRSASTTVDFSSGASRAVSIGTLAEDGITRDAYTVVLRRLPADSNAKLESLEVVDAALFPAFSPARTSYRAEVPFDITQVVVKAKAQSRSATITLQTLAVVGRITSGRTSLASRGSPTDRAGAVIDFSNGSLLPVIVAVTAEDGGVQEYLVEIAKAEPDHNNALAELAVAGGTMTPAFTPRTLRYAVGVPYSTQRLAVTARTQSAYARMELVSLPASIGTAAPMLSASGDLAGRGGVTVEFPTAERIVFAVAVTAQDGRTAQYLLDVRRAPPDSNADLGALAVSAGVLSPIFSPRIISYAVSLPASIDSVRLTASTASPVATVTVEGTTGRPAASQTFAVSVAAGATETVNLMVSAEDGTQKMYARTIVWLSRESARDTNTRLSRLLLAGAQMSPNFDPRVLEYSAQVAPNVTAVTLTATAESTAASIAVDGQPMGRTGRVIEVESGASRTVLIDVTAEAGNVARTVVRLSREAARDTNARLARLARAGAAVRPMFDPRDPQYQAQLAAKVASVVLTATAESPAATIEIDGQPMGRTGRVIEVEPGASRTVLIDVTAEAGNVARTIVRLSREAGGQPGGPGGPGTPGADRISVTLNGVKITRQALGPSAGGQGSIGEEARITARYYRTNTVVAQGTANVEVRMQGGTMSLTASWSSPGVKLDTGKLVEVEVAIQADGATWLHYTEAQWPSPGVAVDVPFLLSSRDPRVAWPAVGRPVSVAGYLPFPAEGPGRSESAAGSEDLELNAKGEYAVEVTLSDPASGRVLGTATVYARPGFGRSSMLAFSRPMSLPEGATVKYTLTAKARNDKGWAASGTTQVWTTNLAPTGGFEPVILRFGERLAPQR